MSTSTATTLAAPSTSTASPLRAVPRAVWVVVGALALATAGLAGALVTRMAAPSAPVAAAVNDASVAAPGAAGQAAAQSAAPVQTAPAVAQRAPQQAAAPARSAAPAPSRVTSHASTQPVQAAPADYQTARVAVCASCGTVESVSPVQQKGEGTGLGAIAGGVVGGLAGNQMGGGNGKAALTVLGAIGGGFAGNEVEKRARAVTSYDVTVRMEDGSTRTLRQAEALAVGTSVQVDGSSLRVTPARGQAPSSGRLLQTGAPT
jgi:outer membrane lipoprotein SlyB